MKPRLLLLVPTSTYRAEAFVRAAQRLPVDLSLASEHPNSLAHLHPVDLPTFDFADAEAAARAARRFAGHTRVDAVVAIDDQSVLAAAAVAAALGIPHHPLDAARAALNKYVARERMRAHGVRVPRYTLLPLSDPVESLERRVAREVGYPAVVKPLGMAASRGVIRVDDAADFRHAFERAGAIVRAEPSRHDELARSHLLVESYIPGWEVAVEGIVTGDHVHVIAIFDKPDPLEGPLFPETMYVTPSRLSGDEQRAIEAATEAAVRAVGLTYGPVHVELRGRGRDVVPIEVHARSIGGMCSRVVRFADGRSLEDVILQHALGLVGRIPAREAAAAGVWMMQAPVAGSFRALRGTEEASRVEGVEDVLVSAREGQMLTPLPQGFLYMAFVFARGDSPGEVEQALRRAFSLLQPEIEPVTAPARA